MKVLKRTPCASAALAYFGVTGTTWNARTKKNVWENTLRRAGYAGRARASKLPKNPTVSRIRQRVAEIAANEPQIKGFVVRVPGHVLVMNRQGQTVRDTDPRVRDRRRVLGIYAIW